MDFIMFYLYKYIIFAYLFQPIATYFIKSFFVHIIIGVMKMKKALLRRMIEHTDVVKECIFKYFELRLGGSSAELSYYFLFSLFPLIMATSAITFMNPSSGDLVIDYMHRLLPEMVSELFSDFSRHISGGNNTAFFSSGILLSLYAVARYINCIKRKLRQIYETDKYRGLFAEWTLSLVYSVFIFVGLLLTFALQTAGGEIVKFLSENMFFVPSVLVALWPMLRFLLIGVYVFFLLILLYKTVPMRKQKFCDIVCGALFSTAAWIIMSVVFSFYIDNISDYSAVYGSIAAFIVLMLWLFLVNNIILTGALVSKVMSEKRKRVNRSYI